MTIPVQMSEEVAGALRHAAPVVALETTLVAHGFPDGQGLAAALAAELRVRSAGATPATIGVADGSVRVGLSGAELDRLASAGGSARKVGARDLAACVAQGALGATTELDVEPLLAEAVERVRDQGVTGQAVTPAVLALVHELSGGQTVAVNRQLIADNAALAAEVAVAYGSLR